MDRRSTLATLLGKSSKTKIAQQKFAAPPPVGALDPYTGAWGFEQAAHLLRRGMFGPTYAQMKQATTDGLDKTVEKLLGITAVDQPLNPSYTSDPYVPVGESWIYKQYERGAANNGDIQNYRRNSLRSWSIERMWKEGVNVKEKMTLFWHNHFAINDVFEPLYEYWYLARLRRLAMGNFKTLVKEITIDAAMLLFLNGNQNTKTAPNENYARELLELFAIGKGPLAGPGDYTHYTEEDIKQAAKILTGWIIEYLPNANGDLVPQGSFRDSRHDTTTKKLSHRFNFAQITPQGKDEYAKLIDVIFQQPECARFICRKLYRWFVYYEITPEIEAAVIEPMAQLMIANNYEVKPVLQALFKSQHFFDVLNFGPMIKNPIEFIIGPLKTFEVPLPTVLHDRYALTLFPYGMYVSGVRQTKYFFREMQMEYLNPPDVAGWKAYYQEPGFYRIWINSATLPVRTVYSSQLVKGMTLSYRYNGVSRPVPFTFDVLSFTSKLDNPHDPNALIDEFVSILFPRPITQQQKDYLKEALLPGLPDYEWTIEYGDYLANPTNKDLRNAVESKLKNLITTMMSMAEFYLM